MLEITKSKNYEKLCKAQKDLATFLFEGNDVLGLVAIGKDDLVVHIAKSHWDGPMPTHFNRFPVRYFLGMSFNRGS